MQALGSQARGCPALGWEAQGWAAQGWRAQGWPARGLLARGLPVQGWVLQGSKSFVTNAPVADLPIRRIVGGRHFVADLTLPYGSVLHDYLA